MAVTLTINGQSIEATSGRSLFDHAEALGIDVPTSCRKQGKCKECMVEVVEGMSALSAIAEPERHLEGQLSAVVSNLCNWRGRPGSLPYDAARTHAHRAARVRTASQQSRVRNSTPR